MLILTILVIGMAAGWLAQWILGRSVNWAEALIAGLVGSFVGGVLVSLLTGAGLGVKPTGLIGAAAGAVLVLAIWGAFRRPSTTRPRG